MKGYEINFNNPKGIEEVEIVRVYTNSYNQSMMVLSDGSKTNALNIDATKELAEKRLVASLNKMAIMGRLGDCNPKLLRKYKIH